MDSDVYLTLDILSGMRLRCHESLKHGFAVASGMELAAVFSYKKGFISSKECSRIINLLEKYNLKRSYTVPAEKIEEFILHDKKKSGTDINFVFVEGIGKASVKNLPVREVIDFYRKHKTGK